MSKKSKKQRPTESERIILAKIARFRLGKPLRVLDLFSGCGGMSLGFHSAGCEIAAAVEIDPDAARSHGQNFHPGDNRHNVARDITATSPEQLAAETGLGEVSQAFDLIIGGPPCQAFARVGRSKLREVSDHPEAFRHDTRARLYIEYIRYVEKCAPLAVVMENVPDMLNFANHNVAEEIAEVLATRGYVCRYTLLNAAFYGVPQMRERMFLVAVRREITATISFPAPSHWIELPSGYEGSRAVALKVLVENGIFNGDNHYVPASAAAPALPKAVTAREAIGDLPRLDARALLAEGKLKRGARRFDTAVAYPATPAPGSYAQSMRNWPGFSNLVGPKDHVIRCLPRDYQLFARMNAGDQYPEAFEHAERLFGEKLTAHTRKAGARPHASSREWKALRKSVVPPYDPGKFPNKWRKMESDSPARTLMAHLGKDSYSHIHYDSAQARTISVREAARLQSFPDGFVFSGTMNPAFRQIGNAVPPLLAKAVAVSVLAQLRAAVIGESAVAV